MDVQDPLHPQTHQDNFCTCPIGQYWMLNMSMCVCVCVCIETHNFPTIFATSIRKLLESMSCLS